MTIEADKNEAKGTAAQPADRTWREAEPPKDLVVLLHGIRTHASWAEMVGSVITRETGAKVIPLKYGFFDVFRFLCPLITRRAPVTRIVRELRDLRTQYPTARISIVAHSFGTYALVKALDEPDIRLHRIILCGCIVDEKFRRARYSAQLAPDSILNDCGTHDIWPVLAKAITWGYGATGTFGFGTVGVRDRYNKFGHGDYFDKEFVRQYWVPFLQTGEIRETEWERNRNTPPYWQSLLSWLPLQWLVVAGACSLAMVAWFRPFGAKPQASVRLGPQLAMGHWLGSPFLIAHLEFRNPTKRPVNFSNLELRLIGPHNLALPMAMEANLVGPNFVPPLTIVNAEPGKTVAFDYSFFNYTPEYTALQQEVAKTYTDSGLAIQNADPTKQLLPDELAKKLVVQAEKTFPWVPGNWVVETRYRLGDIQGTARSRFSLSTDEVTRMIAITNYYSTGIGVFPNWRFLTPAGAQPTLNKTVVNEGDSQR